MKVIHLIKMLSAGWILMKFISSYKVVYKLLWFEASETLRTVAPTTLFRSYF
jgi:hypothetical protein